MVLIDQLNLAINTNRPRYHVYTAFPETADTETPIPYLFPPLPNDTHYESDIAVLVPNVYAGIPGQPPADLPANDDFALTFTQWADVNKVQARVSIRGDKAKLTNTNNNVWKGTATAKETLRMNFAAFASAVDDLEGSGVLVSGGAAIVIQRVAESLPVPLNESLFYRYGFNAGFGAHATPYIDLQPGMRLRMEFAAYQFVTPNSNLNGLVSSGQFFYDISRVSANGTQQIAFDAFMGSISAPNILPGTNTANNVVGIVDLHASGSARRHYRLFFPTSMTGSAAAGDLSTAKNVTLVGADTLVDMQAATQAYLNTGGVAITSGGSAIVYSTFRGRAVAVPEISVYLNQQVGSETHQEYLYVPVGTTLRQLLDRLSSTWNPRSLYAHDGRAIRLKRLWTDEQGLPTYREVVLKPPSAAYGVYREFELPLVKGDRVALELPHN